MRIFTRDSAPLRELLGEPVDPSIAAELEKRPTYRQLSVLFYPAPYGTVWSVVSVDRRGNRRWDRKLGSGTLDTTVEELRGRDLAEVLRILLREALENLS
jgi:hypothetical protein